MLGIKREAVNRLTNLRGFFSLLYMISETQVIIFMIKQM